MGDTRGDGSPDTPLILVWSHGYLTGLKDAQEGSTPSFIYGAMTGACFAIAALWTLMAWGVLR